MLRKNNHAIQAQSALGVLCLLAGIGMGSVGCGSAAAPTNSLASPVIGGRGAAPIVTPGAPQPATAGSASLPPGQGLQKPQAGSGAPIATPPTSGTGAAPAAAGGPLPCTVSKALGACQKCHGATPIGGAPMSLVTYADLTKAATTQASMKVYELAKVRMADKMRPMPPAGTTISAEDAATLTTWFSDGAKPGTAADATCMTAPTVAAPGGDTQEGTFGPLVPLPGETCYEFKNHSATTSVDDKPFTIPVGEQYEQFYFKAPWPSGSIATRFGSKLDNAKVLHHWLLFFTSENQPEGAHATAPLPTLLGVNAQLLAGWALGGPNEAMPPDVGFELPAKGAQLNIQWHFYNSTTSVQTDKSAVQLCVVPASARAHVATQTWVGTEDIGGNKWFGGAGMPPKQMSTFTGTCAPGRKGLGANDPIHIIIFQPHMHQLGVRMQSWVNRKNGMKEAVFDKPFDFTQQIHYPADITLMPGDTLTATCTFNNTTNMGVPFGESSDTEMCYQFVTSWPAHALENGVASLIGATNTCW
jgi:hypothetical protein